MIENNNSKGKRSFRIKNFTKEHQCG